MHIRRIRILLPIILFMLPYFSGYAYEVGHTSIIFTDDGRNRQISVQIYYPADTAGENVPVADAGDAGFPVISFGHGYMMPWNAYANIWTAVVPEGYIVAFPQTAGELFPDHQQFGFDLAFVIQAIRAEGNNSTSLFYQKPGQTSAVMGHSMGGGASFLAAAADSGISGLVNFAAAETSPSAIQSAADITVPALLFAGSDDCITPPSANQIPMYSALSSGCKTLISLTGASHCQFAEYNLTCSLGEVTCPAPGINRTQQHELVDRFLLPWLAAVLKEDEDARLAFENLLDSETGITYLRQCPALSLAPEIGQSAIPSIFRTRNYPNPFNPRTTIEFQLAEPGPVRVHIYNLHGQPVWQKNLGPQPVGVHRFNWDGVNSSGQPLGSGSYFYRLQANGEIRGGTLILLK